MAVVYLLAHFDDEYGAWPLIRRGVTEELEQWFLYVVDYADPRAGRIRGAETRAMLRAAGIDPARVIHVGAGRGANDGAVHERLAAAAEAVRAVLRRIGPVERIIAPAWEGGHPDHDACAFLATLLAPELGDPPIDQFSLYHGRGLPWRLFRACAPIAENGPITRLRLSLAEWVRFAAAVRFFPTQWRSWLGLWPAMLLTFATRGFGYQRLDPGRVAQRPHAGALLYERMFATPYDEVRAAIEAAATGAAPLA